MSNLLAALRSSAGAMGVFERGLTVAQNNVANASTPGYAKQVQGYRALPFDPANGVDGGVAAAPVRSARDWYAEAEVQRQVSLLGNWERQVSTLSPVETGFDMTGTAGISGALSGFYRSVSAWSVTPNDGSARQNVIDAAQQLTEAFHETAANLERASGQADYQIGGLVDQVNTLTRQIRDYNMQMATSGAANAGVEAGMYGALEQLSELVPISVLKDADGTLNVSLNGQTNLVVGQFQYDIKRDISVPDDPPPAYPGPPTTVRILDASGQDITAQVSGGQLGGLLYARNTVLGALTGDTQQPGDLNRLAAAIAQKTTDILTAGNISDGPPPVPGVALFTCDADSPSTAARSIQVAAGAAELAAIKPASGASAELSNGTALDLANLESSAVIDGLTYTQFYGNLAAQIGDALSTARNNQAIQQDVVTQARNLRQQVSGVSLDEEAINVLELQRSYQAAAKLVTVLNELTQTVVDLLR